MTRSNDVLAHAIRETFISPNVCDSNLEAANVVDALANIAKAGFAIRTAITPIAQPGRDETDGHVESLTEAVMGVTAGLVRIADALHDLAAAIREHGGGADKEGRLERCQRDA